MNKPRDPIRDPINLAVDVFRHRLEHFRQQMVVSQEPERVMRLGELPAQPIIDQIAQVIAKES